MCADPRSPIWRRRDTERRLSRDVDVWVASAGTDGSPYLVPLSFDWDGRALLLATPADSPTGRNLAATGRVRLGLGGTRDVTMIDGDVQVLEMDELPAPAADRFAARAGFDPGPKRSGTAGSGSSRTASRPGGRPTNCPDAS